MTTATNRDSAVNQRILSRLVEREVLHCISSTVDHFAKHDEACVDGVYLGDVQDLLSAPDYETAFDEWLRGMDLGELIEFAQENDIFMDTEKETVFPDDYDDEAYLRDVIRESASDDYGSFCSDHDVDTDDYVSEALEHWAVTKWFANRLKQHGQIVGELLDFDVWGRCCSGQSISQDGVIAEIASEMGILDGQEHSWAE